MGGSGPHVSHWSDIVRESGQDDKSNLSSAFIYNGFGVNLRHKPTTFYRAKQGVKVRQTDALTG